MANRQTLSGYNQEGENFLVIYEPNADEKEEGYDAEILFRHSDGDEDYLLLTADEIRVLRDVLHAWTLQ